MKSITTIKPIPQIRQSTPGTATIPNQGGGIIKRRSPRIALNTSIGLSGEGRDRQTFSLTVRATNLNRHGGAIRLNRELVVGSTVLVRNKRGDRASARVVTQVNTAEGLRTYGIEFLDNTEKLKAFWGITFPSA